MQTNAEHLSRRAFLRSAAQLKFMENWDWATGRSTDEIADYLSHALRGRSTPAQGGFQAFAAPPGTWLREDEGMTVCLALPRGASTLELKF